MNTMTMLNIFEYDKIVGELPQSIETLEIDSRKTIVGTAFICIEGFTVDGHQYAKQAVERGASLIIAEKEIDVEAPVVYVKNTKETLQRLAPFFYEMPSKAMHMIGVTGTNGKTTIANIIHQLLQKLGEKSAAMGTIGFQVEDELIDTDNTTPNVLETQKLLQLAKNRGIETTTMEVSSHGLIEGRLAGVVFDTAIFTNLSHDHLDFHGTMEHYGYAKGLLFAQLGQDVTKEKYVILNADDAWSERYRQMTPYPVWSYGFTEDAMYRARIIEMDPAHTIFELTTPKETFEVKTQLVGDFNVLNVVAAMLAVHSRGYEWPAIIEKTQEVTAIKGRMEKVETDLPITLYVDYAHSPDAIEKAIEAILPYKEASQRLLFLIGTGGNRDRAKRPVMAKKASLADYVVLTTDDPRFEGEETILTELEKGMTHNRYATIGDREEAVRHIIREANPNDIIIFAGKGHEDFQVVGNEKLPHSDAAIALDEAKKQFTK